MGAVGYLTSKQYQETPRLRSLEPHVDDLLQGLYGGEMTFSELQDFARDLDAHAGTELEAGEVPPRSNLYSFIEEDCFGPE